MTAPSPRWVKIASSTEELLLNGDDLAEVEVEGKRICLALPGGLVVAPARLFACAAKCPHAGGHLAEGYIDALGNIVCPIHRYKFSLATGRNTTGEGYYLRTYPVDIRPDGVYIGFEEKKWGW